jgi:phosphoglycolate phosphatase
VDSDNQEHKLLDEKGRVSSLPFCYLPMSGIKLIIFDLDGTLVDAYPAIISSFNYTMQRLGYPRQKSGIIRRKVGWGDENLLRPFVKAKDLSLALSIYRRHHQSALRKKSRLFPNVARVLAYLKNKGYRLAVASNRPTRFSWILIRHLKLKKYFSYVLCADKLKHLKPHPYILNKIMQKFKLRPQEACYVGDMAIDAQAGRRAKVKTVMVTTGSSSRQEIKKERPYRIIKRISGILKIF